MKDITKKLQKLAKTRNKKVIVKKGSVKYKDSNNSTSSNEDYNNYSENN